MVYFPSSPAHQFLDNSRISTDFVPPVLAHPPLKTKVVSFFFDPPTKTAPCKHQVKTRTHKYVPNRYVVRLASRYTRTHVGFSQQQKQT